MISIERFQNLYQASLIEASTPAETFDKEVAMVAALTGKPESVIDKWSGAKYRRKARKVKKVFELFAEQLTHGKPKKYVWANGRLYRLSHDIQNDKAGQYVETATFGTDVIMNLHKIMATMATPISWLGKPLKRKHEDIANDFLKADFVIPYHAAVFFCAVFIHSIKDTRPYILNQLKDRKEAEKLLDSLSDTLDGFITAKWYRSTKISA